MDSLNPANYLSYIRPDLSYTPQTPDLGLTDLLSLPDPGVNQPSSQPVDHIQQGLAEMSKLQPDYQTRMQPTYFDYKGTNAARYVGSTNYNALGFDPEIGRENEYKYGDMQTTSDMFGNAFSGAYKLAASTFVDGWKGWGRMTDALFSWDSNKLMGDPDELYRLNEEQKSIMDKYAIYQTKESENSIFNRQLLGDMIQQSGFALGTTAQFLSEELLTMGLSSAFSLTKLGLTSGARIAKGAYKMGEMAADAKKLGDIWKSESIVQKIYDGAKKLVPLVGTADDVVKAHKAGASAVQMASIGLGGIKRSLAEMNMAMTEARMEAAGTFGELHDRLYNEHVQRTGQAPVGAELERIERMSRAGAEDNFMINTGVLAVMNRIQFDNLFSKFAPERKLLKGLSQYGDDVLSVSGKVAGEETTRMYEKGITGALGQAGKIAGDFGKKKAAWEVTKDLGKGLSKWEVSEGVQELIQEGSNIALQDYYYDLYNGKPASMDKSMEKAINKRMNAQGLKTFMMGALTGRLISPITGAFSKGVEMTRTTGEQREARTKDLKESIELINNFYKNPGNALNEAIANFNVQNKAAEKMQDALSKRDEYYYNNIKDSAFAKMVSAAKKTGMFESVLDTIREHGNHLTKEQMKEAFPGIDPTDSNISDAKQYFHKIASEVEDFHKTWEDLQDKFGDLVQPKFYQEGSEDYNIAVQAKRALDDSLEVLATNRFKAARSVQRAQKIYNQVIEDSAVGQSSAYAFRVMSNDDLIQKEIDMLSGEIAMMAQGEGITKEAREQIKKKSEELEHLLEFQKHWKQDEEDKTALLNLPVLKKAYANYINARNESSNLSTKVASTDIDNSWNMFMDYAFLNKDALAYIDAYNTVANPKRFVQMFDARREAIASVVEKMRNQAVEEAVEKTEQKLLPAASVPPAQNNDPQNPGPDGNPAGSGNTGIPEYWHVVETEKGFFVRTPKGKLTTSEPFATLEEAQEEANEYNIMNGIKVPEQPGKPTSNEEPKTNHYVEQTQDGAYVVRTPKKKVVAIFDTLEEAEAEAEELDKLAAAFSKPKPTKQPQTPPPAPKVEPQTEIEKEIDGLSLAKTTSKTLQKAAKAVREVFEKVANDNVLIEKLKAKIGEVKDQVMRNALMQIVTGKADSSVAYVPLNLPVNNAAIGQDKQSVKGVGGINLTGNKDLIRLLSQTSGELAGKITVTATTKLVEANEKEAAALNIPNRKHITYETDSDVKKLQNGKPILTVGKKTRGYHFSINSKVGSGEIYLMGPDTYFIVQPDNTTTPVTFEEHQRAFVKDNLLVDGKPMTDEQFDQLQENFMRFAYFQELVSSVLVDNAEGDITTLFNSYFNVTPGGVIAAQDEDMTDVFRNNSDKLFPVMVKDKEDNITEKRVPLLASRQKGIWKFDFLTADGEIVVDEDGNAIDNVKEYVAENFGVTPRLDYAAPYVWIAYAENATGKHFNKLVGRKRGTEPVEGYKAFLKELNVLNEALLAGVKANRWEYDGRVFTTTNELMTYFNQNKFGFYTVGDWFVDLSYTKQTAKSNAAFTLELRPKDTRLRRALTPEQKSSLNVFFNIKKMNALIDMVTNNKASNEEVTAGYNAWMESLIQGYNKMVDGLKNSSDPVMKELYEKMDYHTLFFYEQEDDKKKFMLKLTDKTQGTAIAPLLTFQGSANNVTGQLNIAFKKDNIEVDITQNGSTSNRSANNIDAIQFTSDLSASIQPIVIDGLSYNVVNTSLRPKVLVNVNGVIIPFYITTGLGGKGLKPGWYPFFGIGKDGWMNKTDKSDMETYYERYWGADAANKVRAISEQLNAFYGTDSNLFESDYDPTTTVRPLNSLADKVEDYINAQLSFTPTNNDENARTILRANVEGLGKKITSTTVSTPTQTGGYTFNPEAFTPEEDPFMLNDQDVRRYTDNVYNDEVNWLLNNASLQQAGIKMADLAGIINKLSAGKEILGYYRNRVIYVNKAMSGEGTVYHEAFHALFRDILNNQQREFYTAKAKQKLGNVSAEAISKFRNERNYHNLNDAQIVNLMAEELLADGFRDYKLKQKEPAEGWFKVFVKFLERLFNLLKSDAITNLYRDFDAGQIKTANSEVSNIADEGVFSLATGRPMLTLRPGANGEMEIRPIVDTRFLRPLNLEVQKEVVNKLTRLVSNKAEGTFEQRFAEAVQELKSDYDINKLIAQAPANEAGIRAKYGNFFTEAAFILGASVPYDTDDSLAGNTDVAKFMVPEGSNKKTLDIIKNEVNGKINSLGLDSGWINGEYMVPEEDDEDAAEKEKGGEFDLIHMNPLSGISKEFRSLFSLIAYKEYDDQLGVTINRTADGNMLFNAVIKVASDRPSKDILPALITAVEALEEDGDRKAPQLRALTDELSKQFGIADLADPNATPSKNLFLYKQFMDTFFVTELPSSIVVVYTSREFGTTTDVHDASINADIKNRKEAIGFNFNRAYKKLKTDDQKIDFINKVDALKDYSKNELVNFLNNGNINNRQLLNKQVDKLYNKLADVNIILPKILLRRSLQAIYVKDMGNNFNANSKESIREIEADQNLIKQDAYLSYDFFKMIEQIDTGVFHNLFADTTDELLKVEGNNLANIDGINKILKKATKLIIKYDINAAIPVFQNAENAQIWRYSRYTPPILMAQMVRENGIEELTKLYPVLTEWFKDNPLFNGSEENKVFLKNLNIEAFNGFRQEKDGQRLDGVTFGNIDTKALLVSNLIHFMNRETITVKRKAENSKQYKEVRVTTFKRSRTQEEATTTNFLVTAKYKKYITGDEVVSQEFIDDVKPFFRQEYNRIQREWANRTKANVTRYLKYNDITGKQEEQRAYKFNNMVHFFDNPSLSKEENKDQKALRDELKDTLIKGAKEGKSFEDILKEDFKDGRTVDDVLNEEFKSYMEGTVVTYVKKLTKLGIINKTTLVNDDTVVTSTFLSPKIKEDFTNDTLKNKGYNNFLDLAVDHHLNVFMNKLMVNQVFDGDIATGIKSSVEYYKRNRSGVISGNSMKRGFFRTAVVENLKVYLNENDLTQPTSDVEGEGLKPVDVADGQSYHTLNHRLRMMDSWGRATPRVRELLNQYQFRPLTKEEIEELADSKVVLNTIKTATGGVLEYYKLSEHLISRVDVSYLNPEKGTKEEAYEALDRLYLRIQSLEDLIVENPSREDVASLEKQIAELYSDVHSYWLPKRNRSKMHYMLNSMEQSGVDQLFDPNASKKTTLVPVKLEADTVTNLTPSKSYTSGLFKFLQVETSGIKKKITDPSQSRQLISTYLNKLDNEKTYQDISLASLAKEYEKVMGDITKAHNRKLNTAIFKDGKFDVASVFTMIRKGLAEQGADSNTLKFFELENGKPIHNVNLPIIKKHFTYYYFSLYNDSIYRVPVSGRSDILVSAYGYEVLYNKLTGEIIRTEDYDENPAAYAGEEYGTRHLGVTTEVKNGKTIYKVEVMIPKPLAKNEAEAKLYLEKLNEFFSTRIPTEDKRSMVVCKVVDYVDAAYQNSIIVPQLVHILAGSDLDVDKLYSHTFDFYTDFNDNPHVYGDYSGFKTESQGKFIEYINYMLNDKTLDDLVKAQIDVVAANPVIPVSFMKLKDELQISDAVLDKEYLVDRRKALELKRAQLAARYGTDKAAHDTAYEAMVQAGRGDKKMQDEFNKARAQYLFTMGQQRTTQDELKETNDELKKINKTIRLIALHNVLVSKGFPTTQSALTKYTADFGNPVVPTLQNERLQMKMDILSNETVFNEQYIKEKSDTTPFSDIAKSIGATVEDVVKENSIHSIMGDVVANELNSSNKDGIGITASFNKFLAFAQKNNLTLPFSVPVIDDSGEVKMYNTFQESDSIKRIGGQLGMFADAAKEPIPSVINLNPETSFVSSMLVSIGVDLQVALLINKLPFIEEATIETINSKSSAEDFNDFVTSIPTQLNGMMTSIYEVLEEENRLHELMVKTKTGKLKLREFYIKKVTPNPNAVNLESPTIADFGIQVLNKDGNVVAEDVAKYYLANLYNTIGELKTTVLPTGSILNLIKQQKPDFYQLDAILSTYESFRREKKDPFKKAIGDILAKSAEYQPLLKAVAEQTENASDILLERSSLFRNMNMALTTAASFTNKNTNTANAFSEQLVKFVLVNRIKSDMIEELKELNEKPNPNATAVKILEEGLNLFNADFWVNNEDAIASRLEYLIEEHPSNPFVDFLKFTRRDGIHFLEASSRMKLDKDIAEGIILGYEALQKSLDPETKAISRFMFYYLLAKDNLGYGSNSFISYISPDLKQYRDVSVVLTNFHDVIKLQEPVVLKYRKRIQSLLNSQLKEEVKQVEIDKIVGEMSGILNKEFDKLFKNDTGKSVDWINLMVRKVLTNAGNQKYFFETTTLKIDSEDKEEFKKIVQDGFFGNRKLKSSGKIDIFPDGVTEFTFDLTNVTDSPMLTNIGYKLNMVFVEDEDTGNLTGMFPSVIKTKSGRLFHLRSLDGDSISKKTVLGVITGNLGSLIGRTAVYKEIKPEGSEKISNLGFTNAEGQKIYEFVEQQRAAKEADKADKRYNAPKNFRAINGSANSEDDKIEIVRIKKGETEQSIMGGSKKITVISGGQTGADILGLEVARELGLKTSGAATRGYKGIASNAADFGLKEYGTIQMSDEEKAFLKGKADQWTNDAQKLYNPRTFLNANRSDATVLFGDVNSAGSKLTVSILNEVGKPYILNPTAAELSEFLKQNNVKTLNVAGNRASKLTAEQIEGYKAVLRSALQDTLKDETSAAPVAQVSQTGGVKAIKLSLLPHNVNLVFAGTKTQTIRPDNPYGLAVGESGVTSSSKGNILVTYLGQKTVDEVGGKAAAIKAEGLKNEAEFQFDRSRDWVNGKIEKLHVFTLAPAPADIKIAPNVPAQTLLSKGEIFDIYQAKEERDETLAQFTNMVNDYIAALGQTKVSKQEIIDQLKSCL